jgi:hypothetical protein
MSEVAIVDTLRTLAFGGISGAFAKVGTPTTNATRLICFTNNTDGDMFFSNDAINNQFFVAAGSFKLLDICSNRDDVNGVYLFPSSMQWWVKQSTAPTKGAVYIEVLYGMA